MPSKCFIRTPAAAFTMCVVLHGCTSPATEQPATAGASSCDKIEQLIEQYNQGFPDVKGHRTETRYGIVWKAKYDAVGKGCEVWEQMQSAPYYVCQQPFADAETASAHYRASVDTVATCLADNWQAKEETLADSQTRRTVFRHAAGAPDIVVRLVDSEGAMGRERWRVFYLVGQAEERAEWQSP